MLYFALEEYGIVTLFDRRDTTIHSERIYLVRLFLEQAGSAIKNISLQEALVRSEKLSAVGQAISMLSHDLRNTLGSITPTIDFIMKNLDDRNRLNSLLPMIKKTAGDSMKMVTDVLDFIRNREVEKADLDLLSMINEVKEAIAEQTSALLPQFLVSCPENITIKGDRTKLQRLLVNLIRNAFEATANIPEAEVILTASVFGDDILITIADNGPGIPAEVMEKLFTPFVTFGKTNGTGLGLAIAKQFVDAHGGKIEVQSSARGTCFSITLPQK